MATWATVQDVLDVTGQTVTEAQLQTAGAVIELFANRSFEAAPAIRPRDLHWLKQATCWQVVWQQDQPGYLSRQQVKQVQQDGARVVYADTDDAVNTATLMLAPLAARSLKNLSWKADRTLRGRNIRVPVGMPADFLNEASDDLHPWSPLEVR